MASSLHREPFEKCNFGAAASSDNSTISQLRQRIMRLEETLQQRDQDITGPPASKEVLHNPEEEKKVDLRFSGQLLWVVFSTFCGQQKKRKI